VSRTVGWFTSEFPVALTVARDAGWGEVLKSVKEQLRAIPRKGLSYGALRYLSPPDSPAGMLRDDPLPQISFNYLGQWGVEATAEGLYRRWGDPVGAGSAPAAARRTRLDVTGSLRAGPLELSR